MDNKKKSAFDIYLSCFLFKNFNQITPKSTKFLHSTTSHLHNILSQTWWSQISFSKRISPLATPCALPSKQRDETASICDGKEGDFVSFDVIGTDQINDMQVNVIKVLVTQ